MSDTLSAKYGRKVQAGELLFREGDEGDDMFVIRSGSIRVYLEAAGTEKTLAILGPGDFVGEMSLLNGKPRSANAMVHEDGELLVVKGRVLEEMIVHNTEIALRLIKRLSTRLDTVDSLIKVLIHRGVEERVVENLKRLADIHGWSPDNPVVIDGDLGAMAEQVGLTAKDVYDVITQLVTVGALEQGESSWSIVDPERLDIFIESLKKD